MIQSNPSNIITTLFHQIKHKIFTKTKTLKNHYNNNQTLKYSTIIRSNSLNIITTLFNQIKPKKLQTKTLNREKQTISFFNQNQTQNFPNKNPKKTQHYLKITTLFHQQQKKTKI